MKSRIIVFLKQHGLVRKVQTTNGGVKALYDPDIYRGDPAAIRCFHDYASECSTEPLEPSLSMSDLESAGVVYLDLDAKVQWDWQDVRDMQELSRFPDRSWLHVRKWVSLRWVVQSLSRSAPCTPAKELPVVRIAPPQWRFEAMDPRKVSASAVLSRFEGARCW